MKASHRRLSKREKNSGGRDCLDRAAEKDIFRRVAKGAEDYKKCMMEVHVTLTKGGLEKPQLEAISFTLLRMKNNAVVFIFSLES